MHRALTALAIPAALAIAACVPPQEVTPQVATSRTGPLAPCPAGPITFIEAPAPGYGTEQTCDIQPPQQLNIRMRPDAGALVRCATLGGTWATGGQVWLCEAVDY